MGKRKWKAKKMEKKLRKINSGGGSDNSQDKTVKTKKRAKPKNIRKNNVNVDRNVNEEENVDKNVYNEEQDQSEDSEGEMASAKKLAAIKNKKKSGGFQSMSLSHHVLKGVLRRGYKVPTPIQRKTIPVILEGKDVVAMARTGSGKTAAFLVPMFERLKTHSTSGIRAMILSPTRELALQTLKFAKEIGKFTGLKAAVILGGDRMDDQFAALHDHPDILIATPGRLLHVLVEMGMKLKAVEYIVFDEADRLFEMGFQDQLQEIIHRLPDSRQTLLFSATLPKSLVEFARAGLTDPTLIRLDVDTKLSENLQLSFFSCRDSDKCALLLYLLKHIIKSNEQTVVFAATKHHVEFLHLLLTLCGLSVTYIYSSLDPAARKINAAKFSLGKCKVLIVTDLAARGIDVPLLDNVINFHFPAKPKLFVHRVGRVARAGRSGIAYSLIAADEMAHFIDLHVFLGRPVKLVPLTQNTPVDEDGWFGEVPQSLLDDQDTEVCHVVKESVELSGLVKVCSNAYKKYSKSRPNPANESVKRVKELVENAVKVGIHPMFSKLDVDEKGARLDMLNALRNYRPKTTIFEINSTTKKAGLAVMKAKRELHEQIIINNEAKRKEKEESLQTSLGLSNVGSSKRKISDEADQKEIESVFDHVVSSRSKQTKVEAPAKKKMKLGVEEVKDKENYIQYRPSDYATEKGLNVGNSFEKQATSAVLDFTNEDENKTVKKKRYWDRKKKKFVTDSDLDDDANNDGESEKKSSFKGQGGKFSVVGMKRRHWHTKGSEYQASSRQNKMKFKKGKMGELKSADQILKNRRRKAKIQNFQKYRENVRAKKQGKPPKGKQSKGKGR
ncbi:ATP-dependent RNA helicase DDX54 [Biomphalaria pfeifferi]|uniref:RNA helicase n=1 Tax=Biomphalaria pfeifferi TaxID=112525 RepID=A0AAD8F0M5_BIOPF|nr:ATP-dependent RNA helicase DDX54 [Biomphalaria pfeifferi]